MERTKPPLLVLNPVLTTIAKTWVNRRGSVRFHFPFNFDCTVKTLTCSLLKYLVCKTRVPQKSVCRACSLVSYTISFKHGMGVLVTGTDSPVSIDSLRMQLPVSKTASHGIWQPWDGITRTSPGTSCSAGIVAISPVDLFLNTVATSEDETVERKLFWF